MKRLLPMLVIAASCLAQNVSEVLKHGEMVFVNSCATGYCHGVGGRSSGAPRLAGRGFTQAYIAGVVARGVPDTSMEPFTSKLSRPDLAAVVAYVATLNGTTDPSLGAQDASPKPTLTGEAARGLYLFTEAVRGFGRCSTCHEVRGLGISVAAPIVKVPGSAAELKALMTPGVKTGSMGDESMPVLVLGEGKRNVVFYDLTSAPPVQRNAEPGDVKLTGGSNWRHSSVIGSYTDSELASILAYLRTAIEP